jgi:hypothetical protein
MQSISTLGPQSAENSLRQRAMLWPLFFLICIGLGYPTLNRYDPRTVVGLYDTSAYYCLVTGEPLQSDQIDLSHRILVPYIAKPIYWLANGHLKTWNSVFFALLVANSFFIATTAWLLVGISYRIAGEFPVALVSGLIYLADFAVANFNLSGYVDSAVNCIIIAVVWSLLAERWWLLPLWGIIGALAKETFVPLAGVLAFAWWFTAYRRGALKLARLAWVGAMVAVGFATLILTMSRSSLPYSPVSFAASRLVYSGNLFLSGLARCLLAREFLYTFSWLLPLGLFRLGRLPKAWVVGTVCASIAALAMGAYDDALGNTTRAIFSACGPLLSLSAALYIAGTANPKA